MTQGAETLLITGGAGAVGRELVGELGGEGRAVVVIDRDAEALEAMRRDHPGVAGYVCDLASAEEVAAVIDRIHDDGHAIDVLVNNAGSIHSEPLINLLKRPDPKHDVATWRSTLADNLDSVFHVSSCVAEKMVARRAKGVIINVSSVAAGGNAGQSAYSAAKAAVNALTVTWAKELGPLGIRVAAIAPGFMDTGSTHAALSEKHVQNWVKRTPIGRLGEAREMALAIRFVMENGYFNGQVLALDGGLTL
ncbi:MAG: SDR family NAD(P)-dependent oxidoreductase [Caulobacterales bacterium]|nr:SDR family NAD(P)-dependent oxidoreductase [Caulobacterales bacterium]